MKCVAHARVRCSVARCVAVCCRVLPCAAVCCRVLKCVLRCVAVHGLRKSSTADILYAVVTEIQALQRPAYHRNNQSECVVVFAMYCGFCSVRTHLSPRLMVYNALCAIHRCSRKQCVAACYSVLRPLEKAVHSLR